MIINNQKFHGGGNLGERKGTDIDEGTNYRDPINKATAGFLSDNSMLN